MRSPLSFFSLALLGAAASLLTGCGSTVTTAVSGGGTTPTPPISSYSGPTFTGRVAAGATPIVGASVQLYAAGATGNGSAPTALLTAPVVTDKTGVFTVDLTYTCPFNTSVLYLVATGGTVGTAAANTGTVLMTSLGACGNVNNGAVFTIDEATTVASAYVFAPFMAAGAKLGATATNSAGLALASGTFANLVNLTGGNMPGATFPVNGTAPVARFYSLANALNACVSSTGATSTACTALFANAPGTSKSVPTNTLDAALNIARNPGANVSALYALALSSTAYSPIPDQQPADWTMFVTYTGGGLANPASVSLDSAGRVWVSNYFSLTGGSSSVSLFTNTGLPIFPNGLSGNNLVESYGAAVDASDNFWVLNQQSSGINGGNGSVTVLNSAGAAIANYSAGGINFPTSISFDSTSAAWIADYGDSRLTILNSSGASLAGGNGYTDGSVQFPTAVAVDSKRNGYIGNSASSMLVKVPLDGSSFTQFACCDGSAAIAIDANDNAWSANYYGDSIGLVSAGGQVLSGGGFVGGGIQHPQYLAVDGAGTVWVSNYRGAGVSELAGATTAIPGQILSPSRGWGSDAHLIESFGLGIDAGGSMWVASFGTSTLVQFIGMAAPVKTPLIGPVRTP